MRSLLIANIETLEGRQFFAAILFGKDGYLLDEIAIPFSMWLQSIDMIREIAERHRIETLEMWTSSKGLYVESLKHAGIAGSLKHDSDTQDTRKLIERNSEILSDLYELKPKQPKPAPPKWKAFLFRVISNLLKRMGVDQYDVRV